MPPAEQEDAVLLQVVTELGVNQWKLIATHIEGRIAGQCRERCALLGGWRLCPSWVKGLREVNPAPTDSGVAAGAGDRWNEHVNPAINTARVSRLQSADFDQALNRLDDDE